MKSKALLGFVLCYSTNPELYIKVMRIQGITATKTALSKKSDALLTIETFCRVFHLFNTSNFKRGGGGADTMRSIH